jgi:DNA-binding beta-propeller fold protein YncE
MKHVAGALLLPAVFACSASAADPVKVSLAGKRPAPIVGRASTVRLTVRPASFTGAVRVIASGPRRFSVRATGRRGSYRARLVFRSPGLWRLSARAGGTTSRLGAVRVRRAPVRPLAFTEPTSIDLEPAGTLLLVEFSRGRVLQVNPATGHLSAVETSLVRPYAVVRAPSGSIYLSVVNQLLRIAGDIPPTTVAEVPAGVEIGPIAAAPNGDVYYSTATQIFRLPGGTGPSVHIAGTGAEGGGGDGGPALDAQFSSPHGLAVAADGALLVSDRGNDRLRRIDPITGVITSFAPVGQPYGIDVAANGTVYVIDGRLNRVVRVSPSGAILGPLGPAFAVPYDVEATATGAAYLLQAGPTGYIRRIAPDGTVTSVSRR